jgi:hypothetical protein
VTKPETVGILSKPFKQECFINYLAKALLGCKYKRTADFDVRPNLRREAIASANQWNQRAKQVVQTLKHVEIAYRVLTTT